MTLIKQVSKLFKIVVLSVFCVLTCFSLTAFADSGLVTIKNTIRAALASSRPDLNIVSIKQSQIEGVYTVSIGEGPTLYFSENGKNFILGDLFRVKKNELVNLDDIRRNNKRSEQINTIDTEDMIIFMATGKRQAVVNIFTDVDCFYCQKLHLEVPMLNQMGIEVRYLAYPRAGIDSGSYNKIATAWCSKDPKDAITRLKKKEVLAENVCLPNPVEEHFILGQRIGVRGTPAMVLESGEMVPGYMSARELGRRMGIK